MQIVICCWCCCFQIEYPTAISGILLIHALQKCKSKIYGVCVYILCVRQFSLCFSLILTQYATTAQLGTTQSIIMYLRMLNELLPFHFFVVRSSAFFLFGLRENGYFSQFSHACPYFAFEESERASLPSIEQCKWEATNKCCLFSVSLSPPSTPRRDKQKWI